MGILETYFAISLIIAAMGAVIIIGSYAAKYVFGTGIWDIDHKRDIDVGLAFIKSSPVFPAAYLYVLYQIHREAIWDFRIALKARLNQ